MSRARHRQGHPAHWGQDFRPPTHKQPCLERSAPSHGEVSQTASKIPVRKRADRGLRPPRRDRTNLTNSPGHQARAVAVTLATAGVSPMSHTTRTPTKVANVMTHNI